MVDYKLKLKALLHDPIDKQYVMWKLRKDHKEVATEYLQQILFGEKIEEKEINDVDAIASAMSRIVVAPQDDDLKEKIEGIELKWEKMEFIDIFSLKKEKVEGPKDENEVKEVFAKLKSLTFKNQDERAELCFLFLWRFLPEIFPWINEHPADSRAPNHSIYDHLVQTSAIISTLPKPSFLLFTIGPVQDFIAKARKTIDLWSGSYLLSYLTFKAIEVIIEKLGPDNVIYPNLLAQPLVDRWLYEKFKNTQIEEDFENEGFFKKFRDNCILREKLTVANFPNRFLAIIPYDKTLAQEVEKKIKDELKKLSERVKDYIQNQTIKDQIEKHLLSFFQIYWVILPWVKNTSGKSYLPDEALSDYEKLISNNNDLYKIVKRIISHSYYKSSNVGATYSLLLELTEKLLGARKSLRNYIQNNYHKGEGEKCHLCGEFEVLLIDQKDNKEAWNKLSRDLVKEGERLCGVCLTKRLLPKIIKEELNLQREIKFPSTSEIATIGEKKRLDNEIKEKFKKELKKIEEKKNWEFPKTVSVPKLEEDLLYEIDGQWLMKESYRVDYFKKEDFKEILKFLDEKKVSPSGYYAILMMDGDNIGKWLKGEFNPKIGEVLDEKIKDILSALNDKEILSILCSFYPSSPSIHQSFSRRISKFALEEVKKIVEEDHYGKLIYAGGDDVLAFLPLEDILKCAYNIQDKFKEVLSPKSSMSTGIVIVHHKYPLYLALEEVRRTEKMAKEKFEKDAFCIKLILHSGEIRETGGKWNLIEFMRNIICKFRTEELPSRFPHEFLEVVKKIQDKEILRSELKRIYLRKVTDKAKDFLDELLNQFENYKYDTVYFANLILISKFIASERRV